MSVPYMKQGRKLLHSIITYLPPITKGVHKGIIQLQTQLRMKNNKIIHEESLVQKMVSFNTYSSTVAASPLLRISCLYHSSGKAEEQF
jgi:hypothetical protein